MKYLYFVLSGGFIIIGAWVSVLNWHAVLSRFFNRKSRESSWIPVVGGAAISIGIFLMPLNGTAKWFWVALLLDWGCLPGIIFTILYYLKRKNKALLKRSMDQSINQ
jgi:hypothetical protein